MPERKQYSLPDLGYAIDALEPVYSAEMLELHHDKHHASYVDGANKTLSRLAEARSAGDYGALNQLQKDFAFHFSGHVLHSLFWKNMNPEGGGDPDGTLAQQLRASFGDIDAAREQFTQAATSIQGSGWAALSFEPMTQSLIVEQIHDHQGNHGNGSVPLLVLDMWEHAYYLQYRNEKKKWAARYWDVVYWPDVASRLESVQRMNLGLAA